MREALEEEEEYTPQERGLEYTIEEDLACQLMYSSKGESVSLPPSLATDSSSVSQARPVKPQSSLSTFSPS